MDVSRGKNICKEHLVNIWFFGDSFIKLYPAEWTLIV
jgi:hypothetical protein